MTNVHMSRAHSVPVELLRSMLVAAEHKGLDFNKALNESGLSHLLPLFEDHHSGARIELEEVGALLRGVWLQLGDEASGFLSRPLKPGYFSMLCHAIITATNLRRSLLRTARFISLISDDLQLELQESGDEARLLIHYKNPHSLDETFFVTSLFVLFIRLSCWMINQPMLLERIQFRFPQPVFHDEYGLMFPCRHDFSQAQNCVAFSRRLLALPVQQDSETLVGFLKHAPESLLTQFRADDSLTAQVKRLLLQRHGMQTELENLSFDEVSEELNMTTHTLRRRLKEEGNSFQEIKDSLRRDRALVLLDKTDTTIQSIATTLGFSEPAAFNRAFKKWTGLTPGAFREHNNKV